MPPTTFYPAPASTDHYPLEETMAGMHTHLPSPAPSLSRGESCIIAYLGHGLWGPKSMRAEQSGSTVSESESESESDGSLTAVATKATKATDPTDSVSHPTESSLGSTTTLSGVCGPDHRALEHEFIRGRTAMPSVPARCKLRPNAPSGDDDEPVSSFDEVLKRKDGTPQCILA